MSIVLPFEAPKNFTFVDITQNGVGIKLGEPEEDNAIKRNVVFVKNGTPQQACTIQASVEILMCTIRGISSSSEYTLGVKACIHGSGACGPALEKSFSTKLEDNMLTLIVDFSNLPAHLFISESKICFHTLLILCLQQRVGGCCGNQPKVEITQSSWTAIYIFPTCRTTYPKKREAAQRLIELFSILSCRVVSHPSSMPKWFDRGSSQTPIMRHDRPQLLSTTQNGVYLAFVKKRTSVLQRRVLVRHYTCL